MATPQELLLERLGETAAQQKWAEHDHLHAAATTTCPITKGLSITEIREAIFARVSGADLLRLQRVCRDFHAAVRQSRVLQHLLFAVKEPDLELVAQYVPDVSTASVACDWALNQLFVASLERFPSDRTIMAVLADIPGETGDIEEACLRLPERRMPHLKIDFRPGYFSTLQSRPLPANKSWADLWLLYPAPPIRLTIEYTARYRITDAVMYDRDGELPYSLRQIYNRVKFSVIVAPLPLSQLLQVARGIRWALNESHFEDARFRDSWITSSEPEIGNHAPQSQLRLPQEIGEYVSRDAEHKLRRIGCRYCHLKHGDDFDCSDIAAKEDELDESMPGYF